MNFWKASPRGEKLYQDNQVRRPGIHVEVNDQMARLWQMQHNTIPKQEREMFDNARVALVHIKDCAAKYENKFERSVFYSFVATMMELTASGLQFDPSTDQWEPDEEHS